MALTNAMIILNEQMELMAQGKIGTTGRVIRIEFADGEREIPEPEEIHTFAYWKECGYSVKNGEHAIAAFPIWKYTSKAAGASEEEAQEKGYCFMKKAFWFKASQVEKIA